MMTSHVLCFVEMMLKTKINRNQNFDQLDCNSEFHAILISVILDTNV